MAMYSDVTTLVNQLNNGDRCWSFSNMEIGTCFTVFFRDIQSNKVHIKVRGETMEKTFSLPTQLRKLITTDIFEKVKDDGMNPVIKYKGKNKHQKIKDREYHTFEIVKVLNKDGKEVTNSSTIIPPLSTTVPYYDGPPTRGDGWAGDCGLKNN